VQTTPPTALDQDAAKPAAAEKRQLLARLLGRLAHEIRNPLSSLDIHVQLLEEDLATMAPAKHSQFSHRLEIIRGELHRLESIVSQFLRLTNPSTLELEELEIQGLLEHVCALMRPEAGVRDIEIVARIAPELPRISADRVRLTQALLNLVINALQAVERNGRIEVWTELAPEGIWLGVSDTGPGIPPDRLPLLFDPYFTTKSDGHGLGLWIAQQIVTAHGGTLRAGNLSEGGAVFSMLLPLGGQPSDAEDSPPE